MASRPKDFARSPNGERNAEFAATTRARFERTRTLIAEFVSVAGKELQYTQRLRRENGTPTEDRPAGRFRIQP
jgi:hypothetical protein